MPAKKGFNQILLYSIPNGKVKVEIYLQNKMIWLSQQKISNLLGWERSVVTKHLKNIFLGGKLSENLVSAKIAHTAADTKAYKTACYNLDAIITVEWLVQNKSQFTKTT